MVGGVVGGANVCAGAVWAGAVTNGVAAGGAVGALVAGGAVVADGSVEGAVTEVGAVAGAGVRTAADERPGRVSATTTERQPAEITAPAVSHRVLRVRRASPSSRCISFFMGSSIGRAGEWAGKAKVKVRTSHPCCWKCGNPVPAR